MHILIFRSELSKEKKAKLAYYHLIRMRGMYKLSGDLGDYENLLRLECDPEIPPDQIEYQSATLL